MKIICRVLKESRKISTVYKMFIKNLVKRLDKRVEMGYIISAG